LKVEVEDAMFEIGMRCCAFLISMVVEMGNLLFFKWAKRAPISVLRFAPRVFGALFKWVWRDG